MMTTYITRSISIIDIGVATQFGSIPAVTGARQSGGVRLVAGVDDCRSLGAAGLSMSTQFGHVFV